MSAILLIATELRTSLEVRFVPQAEVAPEIDKVATDAGPDESGEGCVRAGCGLVSPHRAATPRN
jgi:hypothetical protein